MKYLDITDHTQLLLTNKVELNQDDLVSMQGLVKIPYLILVRDRYAFKTELIVLDGNHRAVAAAYFKKRLPSIILESEEDIDVLLRLEFNEKIPPFPHRGFCTGATSYRGLVQQAIWAAGREMSFVSAAEVARKFVDTNFFVEIPRLHVPEHTSTPVELIKEKIFQHRFVSQKGETRIPPQNQQIRHGSYRVLADPPLFRAHTAPDAEQDRRKPFHTTFAGLKVTSGPPRDSEFPIELWAHAIRESFLPKFGDREFACPYSEFARLCGEQPSRGVTIATKLIENRILQRLGVRNVGTGEYFESGKPKTQRVTFWRLLAGQ